MPFSKFYLLVVTVTISLCIAQERNISGRVTNSDGTAISGAEVKLEGDKANAITGTDGKFTITPTDINLNFNNFKAPKLSATINNGFIYLNLQKRSSVEIITYTLQGRIVHKLKKVLESGANIVKKPQLGAGVYIHKIHSRSGELIIKNLSTHRTSTGTALITNSPPATALSLNKQPGSRFEDVVKSTKSGYLNCRVIITNPDTSGLQIKMISQDEGTVADLDGNVYHAIKIGNQVWTVENLKTTKYNDGTEITCIEDNTLWKNNKTGAYCYHDNDSAYNAEKYGALYNWHAVKTGKLAPEGWHVPTRAEWETLQNYLIANGYNWDETTEYNKTGKSLAAKTDWDSSNVEGEVGNNMSTNNSSGFLALPGGCREVNGGFNQNKKSRNCFWWSATSTTVPLLTYHCHLKYNTGYFDWNQRLHGKGFSVRLLRD